MGSVTLYHGTIHDLDKIDVTRGRFFKDFGRGFYATEEYEHAVSIAKRNRGVELERTSLMEKQHDIPIYVYSYEFDTSHLATLHVKRFENPSVDWVSFVVRNRSERNYVHGYDIVIGATANDDTRITIQQYLIGAFGEPGSDEAIDGFLKRIKPEKLPSQWLFATQTAAAVLKFTHRRTIR